MVGWGKGRGLTLSQLCRSYQGRAKGWAGGGGGVRDERSKCQRERGDKESDQRERERH